MKVKTVFNQGELVFTVEYVNSNEYKVFSRVIKYIIIRDSMIEYAFTYDIAVPEGLCFRTETEANEICEKLNKFLRKEE